MINNMKRETIELCRLIANSETPEEAVHKAIDVISNYLRGTQNAMYSSEEE